MSRSDFIDQTAKDIMISLISYHGKSIWVWYTKEELADLAIKQAVALADKLYH